MKILIVLFLSIGSLAYSLETDQFLASTQIIKDSADLLNVYFYKQINKTLDHVNSKKSDNYKCSAIADDVLTNLVGKYSISKISQYAKKSPDIDKYPDLNISDKEYFKMTMYENAGVMLKMAPLARTININGVYMGTDKLGHFSLVGRNYYRSYLKNLEKNMDMNAAMEAAIVRGFKTEKGILGYGIGGVLSFGDLEANYEGLQFAIDLCDKEIIQKVDGIWKTNENRKFDIRNYFNPKMDESYSFSFWRPYLYKRISEKMSKEYCEVRKNPLYIQRIAKYPQLINENINDRLIRENILVMDKFDRKLEDVKSICGE